jgi:preprotein translocase subunit SecA
VAMLAVQRGRPVLIGTRSVGASEEISAVLAARGIVHSLLNAKQDGEEATVIAAAGERGRVTVATNMAGRGTDIRLQPGVAELGGLHVILTEFHDSRRVDRQLFGRCARQGNPGSCQAIVSLEDDLFLTYAPGLTSNLARLRRSGIPLPGGVYQALRRVAQGAAERYAGEARVQSLLADRQMDQTLAFSGRGE